MEHFLFTTIADETCSIIGDENSCETPLSVSKQYIYIYKSTNITSSIYNIYILFKHFIKIYRTVQMVEPSKHCNLCKIEY